MPFYPQNSVQPQCRTRSKPNLNIIFVLIILTDAQVFESVKKYGGQGYLAAPYFTWVYLGINNGLHSAHVLNCCNLDLFRN